MTSARGKFPVFVLGAAVASLVWLLIVMVTGMTPGEARERRAAPTLPPPTATIQEEVLRQVVWLECLATKATVAISAPRVPDGYRPVITSVTRSGSKATTGRVLVRIAGRSVIAVASETPLYRDLTLGDDGEDVRAFEDALAEAHVIPAADGVIDERTLAAWRKLDPAGPSGVVPIGSIAQVPVGGRVGDVLVNVGDAVKQGDPLIQVEASTDYFECTGASRGADVTAQNVQLEIDGVKTKVDRVERVPTTGDGSADGVPKVRVYPAGDARADRARLAIQSAGSEGAVLAVPAMGIKTDADGNSVVVVVEGKSRKKVRVTLGVTAQGMVEVRGTGLRSGDQVEIFGILDAAPAVSSHGP